MSVLVSVTSYMSILASVTSCQILVSRHVSSCVCCVMLVLVFVAPCEFLCLLRRVSSCVGYILATRPVCAVCMNCMKMRKTEEGWGGSRRNRNG